MVQCVKCNAANGDDCEYCNACGARLVQMAVACDACGLLCSLADRFCAHCGAPKEPMKPAPSVAQSVSVQESTVVSTSDPNIDVKNAKRAVEAEKKQLKEEKRRAAAAEKARLKQQKLDEKAAALRTQREQEMERRRVAALPSCVVCTTPIESGAISLSLSGDRTKGDAHDTCAKCATCRCNLSAQTTPLPVFVKSESALLCHTCHAARKYCARCQKLIDAQYIEVGDRQWHRDCLRCEKCKSQLADSGVFQGPNDSIMCQACASNAPTTDSSSGSKPSLGRAFSLTGLFKREKSSNPKSPKSPKSSNSSTTTTTTTTSKQTVSPRIKCKKCSKGITGQYVSFDGKEYHEACFQCCKCKCQLNASGFSSIGKKQACVPCANKHAK